MQLAATKIHALGAKNVVIKGGKALAHDKAVDLFFNGTEFKLLETEKVASTYNHGAGCTFAASICANLANGFQLKKPLLKQKSLFLLRLNMAGR